MPIPIRDSTMNGRNNWSRRKKKPQRFDILFEKIFSDIRLDFQEYERKRATSRKLLKDLQNKNKARL